jgi:2-oxo-hept-3-ene-1,7-dioate hydratase
MPLPISTIERLAGELATAESGRKQVRRFSEQEPTLTIADAYAVQQAWVSTKIAGGRRVIGHKIGLTSRSMQRSSGINEPDYGVLLDDMLFPDGSDIEIDRFIEPRVEVELAFHLTSELRGPDCTIFDVLAATDYLIPAVEIIDARIQRFDPVTGAPRKVTDTISDNAASAGLILGGRPVPPESVDLRWISALLFRNGVIEDSGVAAAVLGHPAHGIAWLANRLSAFDQPLNPGDIFLAGSFTAPMTVARGDTMHVDYGVLGSISARFV